MPDDDYIRGRLASAVAMPDTLEIPPPLGAELRARARRTRTRRHIRALGTVVIVAAVVAAAALVHPLSQSRAPADARVGVAQQLTTAVNISTVQASSASPCRLGWTPSWSGTHCYSVMPEGPLSSPTNLRLLSVVGAKVLAPTGADPKDASARIELLLRQPDAATLGQLYRSGAQLAVSVSGRMIVNRLQPTRNASTLSLEASASTIDWAWHALTVKDPPAWPPPDTFWDSQRTCDEKGSRTPPPARSMPTAPPNGQMHAADSPPLWWVCLPTTGAGFRKRVVASGSSVDPRTAATVRNTALTWFIVGNAPQQVFHDLNLTSPTGQQALIQVSYAGYFAAHGNPQRTGTILDHVTALGAPAVVVPGHNPDAVKVLVTAHGYDISAEGSGRYKNLAPITTDQLVAIIDSIHGL